jgi:hypothetical protein
MTHDEYLVLPCLDVEAVGVVRRASDLPDETDRRVHLRQGDAEGACGPYCVFMGLMMLGLADRQVITDFGGGTGTERQHKLLRALEKDHTALFRRGTNLGQLKDLIEENYKRGLTLELPELAGKACRLFVEEELLAGHPVIVGIDGENVSHFVLAVGVRRRASEGNKRGEGGDAKVDHILILDSGAPPPRASAWNGMISTAPTSKGRYPYAWWSGEDGESKNVAFSGALSLRRTS